MPSRVAPLPSALLVLLLRIWVLGRNEARGAYDGPTHVEDMGVLLPVDFGGQLSELTHSEEPWLSARGTCKRGERCNTVITKGEIALYYSQDGLSNPLFNGN